MHRKVAISLGLLFIFLSIFAIGCMKVTVNTPLPTITQTLLSITQTTYHATSTPYRQVKHTQTIVAHTAPPSGQITLDALHMNKLDSQLQTLLSNYLVNRDVDQIATNLGITLSDSAEVLVDVYVISSAEEMKSQLENLGMEVAAVNSAYGIVEGWLPLDAVITISGLENVKAIITVSAYGTDNTDQ